MAGAAGGNRTRALSLEGRCATTTLRLLTPQRAALFHPAVAPRPYRGMIHCLDGRSSTTELLPLDQRIGRPQDKVKEGWRPRALNYEAIAPSRPRADDLAPRG